MTKLLQGTACIRRAVGAVLVVCVVWGLGGLVGVAQTPLSPGASLPSVESPFQRLDGSSVRPQDLLGTKGTVFLFWSTKCPWIDRYEQRVQALVSDFQDNGIRFVRVNSNKGEDVSKERVAEKGYSAPYVRDPTAAFAQALGATRTPQAFVFDARRTLVYTGAIDDNPSGAEQVKTPYLRNALEALQSGGQVPKQQTKVFGCALKYPE